MSPDRWPGRRIRVGPFGFHLRTPVATVARDIDNLYRDYPTLGEGEVADYMVSIRPASPFRRLIRPKLVLDCDIEVPEMAPLPPAHGLLGLEMGMNLQVAVGMHRYLLLHAGAVERDGGGLILSADSGSGKSTLAAVLGHGGWRFLGDEFALIDPVTAQLVPFPRPASLKNESIALIEARVAADRFGPVFENTFKGTVRHVLPPRDAIEAMDRPAAPRLLLLPAFAAGASGAARALEPLETFMQLIRSSTNYGRLGEAGFDVAWRLSQQVPAYEIVYGSTEQALDLVESLWSRHD